VSLENTPRKSLTIYDGEHAVEARHINYYLANSEEVAVLARSKPLVPWLPEMEYGNKAADDGHLILEHPEAKELKNSTPEAAGMIRRLRGSQEVMKGLDRYCLWINDDQIFEATNIADINLRINRVKSYRLTSKDTGLRRLASKPHQFREMKMSDAHTIFVPGLSSERREYLPVGLVESDVVVSLTAFAIYDGPIFCLSLISSKLNYVWNLTISGKMKTDVRYSNSMGWNTFPVPPLTEHNMADLTRCAEDILLAREAHFPATIAELYDPEKMPADLRAAHERNDETLERIYIGRRFKNDTERLEKLFELYTKMTANAPAAKKAAKRAPRR
jgi:hypothetical protein